MVSKKKPESAAELPSQDEAGAVVPAVDEAAKESWRERSRQDVGSLTVNHDKVLTRVIAMETIDFVLNGAEKSHEYYDARLKPLGLRTSGDKVAMRAATLATRLDRQDTIVGESRR